MSINLGTTTSLYTSHNTRPFQSTIVKSSSGILFLFARISEHVYYKKSADDGATWDVDWILCEGVHSWIESFDVFIDSSDNIHVLIHGQYFNERVYYRKLTHSDGVWTLQPRALVSAGSVADGPKFLIQSDGTYWMSAYGTLYYSINSGDSWSFVSHPDSYGTTNCAIPLTSGGIRLFVHKNNGIFYYDYVDSAWGAKQTVVASGLTTSIYSLGVGKISDTNIWISTRTTSGIKIFHYNGVSWDAGELLSDNANDTSPAISIVNGLPMVCWVDYDGTNYNVAYRKYTGSDWSPVVLVTDDEVVARNITVAVSDDEFGYITWYSGSQAEYSVLFEKISIANPTETITVDENLTVAESDSLNVSQETIEVDETLSLNDIDDLSANSIMVDESLTLSESDELIRHAIDIDENLTLNDSQVVDVNKIEVDESLTLDETSALSTITPVDYATKILSVNPLFIALNTSPAKIAKIDISDVFNPTWEVYTITGCSNVNNISYNSTTGYLYALCDSGELVKILASDLSSYTIIDTLDTNNLELGSVFSDEFKMFAGTDDNSGEIIVVDEANVESLSLDIRYIQRVTNYIPLFINTVLGKKVNLDIRYAKTVSTALGLDIRFLKYDYSQVSQSPLTYDDWQVKIDNVDMIPLNDIDMKSIVITHTADSKSSVSFVLHRVHDKLNYRNDGVASQITNNNTVKIYIDGKEEFNGKISNIEVDSESERVMVTAKMNEPADSRHKVNIPIPSVNEQLNLYHCLHQSFSIDNPFVDESEENPEYYKGVKIDLGTSIAQKISRYTSFTDVASQIQAGTFTPKQNWSYFWLASIKYLFTSGMFGETSSIVSNRYIGTSLQAITSDVIELNSANYCYQREYDDVEKNIGYHYVGNAPYMEITSANGRLTTKQRWDDREDGLYIIKDSSYDYVNYAKQIASLEYEKLQNINGDVLPIVNGEITLTLNGYYFYNVKLLTRINLTNTTTAGIYKDVNGFPVSVKSIRISSADMKVQLSCDNQKSQQEIEEIDARYPVQEDSETPGTESRVYRKYDIAKKVYVS